MINSKKNSEKGGSKHLASKGKDGDVLAPKPVHPRAIRFHGLFGMSFVNQHTIVDERWTPNSLTEQIAGMADLLQRHVVYKRYESKDNRKHYVRACKRLKLQCRDGRAKLRYIESEDNTHKISNLLSRHKDMQRLYKKMPIHLVVDNINQRTFVLRKERDRLEFRLNQRKLEYKQLLLESADLENRIKYSNEFVLEEEMTSRVLLKKIENSNVRLKAIKTINTTYKKIIQVLVQDAIFYEPILRSLKIDMEDQANYIKHILYLGMPAIAKFKKLNYEYRQMEDKSRKNLQAKLHMLNTLRKPPVATKSCAKNQAELHKSTDPKRYVRETRSMMILKIVQESLESTIKEIKSVSLCSQANEIYPYMKSLVHKNERLHRSVENDTLAHKMFETKSKNANVMKDLLMNNLSEEEINRLERIKDLKKTLLKEEEFERTTLEHIKNRADAYVMLRINIWNLIEILRHVDRKPRTLHANYPNSYLKLPLLKFEMLMMRAAPPELYEENLDTLMHLLKRKVYKLMKGYLVELKPSMIKRNKEEYHDEFLATRSSRELNEDDDQGLDYQAFDLMEENKTMAHIPNRKQIKAASARHLDNIAKRDA